ncbi:hypothetical protein ACS127_05540 [Amphibacillus sp. Q70]
MNKPLNFQEQFEGQLLPEEEIKKSKTLQSINFLSDLYLKYEEKIEENLI